MSGFIRPSHIPFNRVGLTGREKEYVVQSLDSGHLSGDGPFTRKCHGWLKEHIGCPSALLTTSCTTALEMAALLIGVGPGDEVIMPSFTFVTTANAFVGRGATPVFVDVRRDTMNLDETLVEAAITTHTKAIVVVHYGGVACEMDAIMALAEKYGLLVVEDAAQAILSTYKERRLGAIGHLAAFSFHGTKNLVCGEGGALLINDQRFAARAEIIREKGTDRSRFLRGEVDKYTWVDMGSSCLPSDLLAAVLWAQLEAAQEINARRVDIWNAYHAGLVPLERRDMLVRPRIPGHCIHNGHAYWFHLDASRKRDAVLARMKEMGVAATFHYVPLHDSPGGRRFGRVNGRLPLTEALAGQLIRLPLFAGLYPEEIDWILETLHEALRAG